MAQPLAALLAQTGQRPLAGAAPLRRAVLAALSPQGGSAAAAWAVIEGAAALSCDWLQMPAPPLQALLPPHAALPATSGVAAIEDACLALADQAYAQMPAGAGAGGGLAAPQPGPIDLWVVLDLTAPPAAGSSASRATPLAAQIEAAQRSLEAVAAAVYRRLKLRLEVDLLVLARPEDQRLAAAWVAGLQAVCAEPIFVAGPLNRDHLVVSDWQGRAATALAVLLWSDWRSHIGLLPAGGPGLWVQALGAAAWRAPRPELQRRLALRWAEHLLAQIGAVPDPQPDARPGRLPRVDAAAALRQIDSRLPGPLQMAGAPRHPALGRLSTLAAATLAQVQAAAAPRRTRQAALRAGWLVEQQSAWRSALAALAPARLAPDPALGWPQPWVYCAELDAALDALRGQTAQVEEWLETANAQAAQAGAKVDQTRAGLERCCARLAARSSAGVVRLALWPGGWLPWLARYGRDLPRLRQALLDACVRQEQAEWRQANLLAVRQALLAQAQAVLAARRAAQAVAGQVEAVAGLLAQGTPWGGLFAPWDEAKLAALYDRLLAEGQAEAARRFLARRPLAEWPQQPADALAAALYGWTAETLAEVAAWTPAQTLAAALPADADLAAWCARLVGEALPLWPSQPFLPRTPRIDLMLAPETPESVSPKLVSPEPLSAATNGNSAEDGEAGRLLDRIAGEVMRQMALPSHAPPSAAAACQDRLALALAQALVEARSSAPPRWSPTAAEGLGCLRLALVDIAARDC